MKKLYNDAPFMNKKKSVSNEELQTQLAKKANDADVRKKAEKLSQTDMTEEFLQQMAGTTPINAVPADSSLTPVKFTDGAKNVQPFVWTTNPQNVVKGTNTLTIGGPSKVGVIYRGSFFYLSAGTYTFSATDRYLVIRGWGTTTLTEVARGSVLDTDIIVAYYGASIWTIWDTIFNDLNKMTTSPLQTINRTPLGGYATLTSMVAFNIDTTAKTITFHANTYINYNEKFIKLANTVVDITNALVGGWLWYDVSANTVTATKPAGENYLYLGTIWQVSSSNQRYIFCINQDCGFTVNGMPYHYTQSKYQGQKINCLGDSITLGSGVKPYWQWLFQLCGFNTTMNYGVSGSSIARKSTPVIEWDTAAPFVDRYAAMDNDADVITIFGGVNDWVTGRPIGTLVDTVDTTFYGALKILLEGLIAKYPNKRILFISPIQNDYVNRPPHGGATDGTNYVGKTLRDYVNVIKEVCGIYSIPVLDLYHNCFYGLSSAVTTNYMPDFLHPNDSGHKVIARKISAFINEH